MASQLYLFGLALFTLGVCYHIGAASGYITLLSGALFFIIDDWALVQIFVIERGARLPPLQYVIIVLSDITIAVADCLAGREMTKTLSGNSPSWWSWTSLLIVAIHVLLVAVPATLLFRNVEKKRETPLAEAN